MACEGPGVLLCEMIRGERALGSILATETYYRLEAFIKGPPLLPHATPLASRLLDGFRAGQLAARILEKCCSESIGYCGVGTGKSGPETQYLY